MDQFYVEEGYVDVAYFEIIVDSGVIAITPYFDEDYTDINYVDNNGSYFQLYADTSAVIVTGSGIIASAGSLTAVVGTLETAEVSMSVAANIVTDNRTFIGGDAALSVAASVDSTAYRIIEGGATIDSAMTASLTAIAYKNHDASLDSEFTQITDVNYIADASGLLEYFAALDAQAARFRESAVDFTATFYTSDSSGELGTDIDASVIVDAASILTTSATLSVDVEKFTYIQADAELNSQFAVSANAIEYILRPNTYSRPINLIKDASDSFVTSPVKFGSHSLKVTDNGGSFTELSTAFGINTTEDFVAEGWFNINDTNALTVANGTKLFSIGYGENAINTFNETFTITRRGFSVGLSPVVNNQRTFVIRYRNGSSWVNAVTTQTQPSSNVWFHLAVVRESGVLKLLYNNNLIFSTSYNVGWTIDTNYNKIYFEHNYTINPNDNVFYDAFRFAKGTSAITGLSQEPVDTEQTVVLYNFNNTTDDSYIRAITFSAQANLSAQTTTIANADLSADADANLSVISSVNALVGKITQATSDFDAVASQLTAVGKIGEFFVNADIVSNFNIQEDLFKGFEADTSSNFTAQIDPVKTADLLSMLVIGEFTANIQTDGFKGFAANLNSSTSLDIDVEVTRNLSADFSATSALTAEAVTVTDTDATLNSAFTQDAIDFNRYRDADANLEVAGSQLSIVVKTADFFVNADVVANLNAVAVIRAGVVVEDFVNAFAFTIDFDRIRSDSADIASEFTSEASGVFVTDTNADLAVAATAEIDAQRFVGVETDFDAIATQLTAIGKIAPYTAGLESEFNFNVDAVKTTDTTADIQSAASAETTATRIKPLAAAISSETTASAELTKITGFAADINSIASLTASGIVKVFNLDQYVYTIPAETRTYTINSESRSHSITEETRTYTIEG